MTIGGSVRDVAFLRQHVDTVVLGDPDDGAAVAVVGAYQGRVMTSTATGNSGLSFGWINYEHIASGKRSPHINVYGGEERFWLGPEGGQFSIFFQPGAAFTLKNWQTPPVIDTAEYELTSRTNTSVSFQHQASIRNYSSTSFQLLIERRIELLDDKAIGDSLRLQGPLPAAVAYRTINRLTNTGPTDWSKDTGLLSIWLLGMYKHGPRTTVVIPYQPGKEEQLGPVVIDDYFGKVPEHRLKVADGVIYFSGDGKYRSKIGLMSAACHADLRQL